MTGAELLQSFCRGGVLWGIPRLDLRVSVLPDSREEHSLVRVCSRGAIHREFLVIVPLRLCNAVVLLHCKSFCYKIDTSGGLEFVDVSQCVVDRKCHFCCNDGCGWIYCEANET